MTLPARLEDATQRQIISYIEAVVPKALVWACPNAARRSTSGKPMNAVPGLRKGAPDLIVALPGGKTLHVEVKSPKGRLSLEQCTFLGELDSLGHAWIIARDINDIRIALEAYGVETREAK